MGGRGWSIIRCHLPLNTFSKQTIYICIVWECGPASFLLHPSSSQPTCSTLTLNPKSTLFNARVISSHCKRVHLSPSYRLYSTRATPLIPPRIRLSHDWCYYYHHYHQKSISRHRVHSIKLFKETKLFNLLLLHSVSDLHIIRRRNRKEIE